MAVFLTERLLGGAKIVTFCLKGVRLGFGGVKRGCLLSIIGVMRLYYDVLHKFEISMSVVNT